MGDLATEHIGSFQRFAQDIKQLFVVQAIFGRDERVLDFVKNAKQLRTLSLKFPVRNAGMRADLPRYFVQMHDLLDQYLATHTQLLYLHLKHIALSEGPGKRHAITLQFQLRQLLLVGCVISDSDLSALLTSQQYRCVGPMRIRLYRFSPLTRLHSLRSLGLSRIAGPSLSGFIEAVKVISCNLEELFLNLLPYKEPRGPGAPRTDSRAFLDMPICLQYGGFLPTNSLMGASAPILSQCQQLHTLELRDPLVQTTDLEQLLNVRRLHVFLTTKEGVPLDLPALLTRKQLPALQQLTISAHDAVWLPTASYGRYDVDQNMEDFERRMRNAPFTVEFRDLHNAEATSIALHHTLMMETEEECMATWQ